MKCKLTRNLLKLDSLNSSASSSCRRIFLKCSKNMHTSSLCKAAESRTLDEKVVVEDAPETTDYTETPQYPTDIPSLYTDTPERIAYGRHLLRKIVRDLPTVEQKIHFINPYERPWVNVEIRRHRMWLPPLLEPRKAYPLDPVPQCYDSLKMYKYVTNTHVVQGLPACYDSLQISEDHKCRFEAGLSQILRDELRGRLKLSDSGDYFQCQLADLVLTSFASEFPHFKDYRIGNMVRYESFIERGGFKHLYDDYKDPDDLPGRLPCDNRYKMGELAFCFRDKANVQIRSSLSLPPFVSTDDPICNSVVEDFKYSPASYTKQPDPNPLWMIPGFEYGDPCDFGHLMINSMKGCPEVLEKEWKAEAEENNECLLSMAISSCFSWLNAQAHYKGFNQYNDLLYPLMTQAIFSDGRSWLFASYQLNSLDLLTEFHFEKYPYLSSVSPRKCNLCWYDGPFSLYESYAPESGEFLNFDRTVVEKIFKFFLLAPRQRPEIEDYSPYVLKLEQMDDSQANVIERFVQEQQDIQYTC